MALSQRMRMVLRGPRRARQRGIFEPAAVERLLTSGSAASNTQDADAIWGLFNLELWYRTFIDGGGVQTLPDVKAAPLPHDALEATA